MAHQNGFIKTKNMKNIITTTVFLLSILNCFSQTSDWLWAIREGKTSNDGGYDIINDLNGNVIVTGYFGSDTLFIGNDTLVNASNSQDIFVAKYNSSGNAVWAKRAGGSKLDNGEGIAVDQTGNIFVTGRFFSPTITFGNYTLTNADNTGNTQDVFIVKYNSIGEVLWAKSAGGVGDDLGNEIAVDQSGNAIIVGSFKSATIVFGLTTLTNNGVDDIFLVKYDNSGSVLWAKGNGGSGFESGRGVTTDANDNIIITGSFYSPTLTFGNTTLTNTTNGAYDVFIAKYDNAGTALWAKKEGGIWNEFGNSVCTDANGNIFVGGIFSSGSITIGSTTLTNANSTGNPFDIFIAKYNPQGTVLWANSAQGTAANTDNDVLAALCVNSNGEVLVTGGYYSTTLTFGNIVLTNLSNNNSDIFVAKYDVNGNAAWAKSVGGANGDDGLGISVDLDDNIYVTGQFRSSSISFSSHSLQNANTSFADVFVAKYGEDIGVGMENVEHNIYSVFPNPATTEITVNGFSPTYLKLLNAVGQMVVMSKGNKLSIGDLPQGLYVLQMFDGNGQQVKSEKVIVAK